MVLPRNDRITSTNDQEHILRINIPKIAYGMVVLLIVTSIGRSSLLMSPAHEILHMDIRTDNLP